MAASPAEAWRALAMCAQTDPEAFFPGKGRSPRDAVKVCQRCQVRAECLAWAVEHDVRFGVWGGTTARDRRRMRRKVRQALTQLPIGGEAA
jgi:WhiB family redox-sensing transcriptional regulator